MFTTAHGVDGTLIFSIFQRWELGLKKIKWPSQGFLARKYGAGLQSRFCDSTVHTFCALTHCLAAPQIIYRNLCVQGWPWVTHLGLRWKMIAFLITGTQLDYLSNNLTLLKIHQGKLQWWGQTLGSSPTTLLCSFNAWNATISGLFFWLIRSSHPG